MGFFSKCQTIPGSSIRKYLTFHPNDSEERLSPSDHQQIYGHDINRLSVHRPVIIPAVNFSAAMTWGGSIKLFDGALWSFLVNKHFLLYICKAKCVSILNLAPLAVLLCAINWLNKGYYS